MNFRKRNLLTTPTLLNKFLHEGGIEPEWIEFFGSPASINAASQSKDKRLQKC